MLGRLRLRWLDALCLGLVGLLLGWAYTSTLAPSITWAHDSADSGDLATAAATLGVAHPSGYPTYLLLAQLFLALPFGEPALRTNLLSACAGLLAACCVYLLVRRLTSTGSLIGAAGGLLGALALGLAPLFWSQALITEVYTLHALFVGLLLLCIQRPARTPGGLAGQGLLLGLALGNHLTIALFGVVWLGGVAVSTVRLESVSVQTTDDRRLTAGRGRPSVVGRHAPTGKRLSRTSWLSGQRWRGMLVALGGLGAGLSVYTYLPLRAAAHPPINWGAPADWAGFWWVASGALYRPLAFGVPLSQLGARLADVEALFFRQLGPAGLALAGIGLLFGAPSRRGLLALTVALALAQAIFALCYNITDYQVQLIPALLIVALWVGVGSAVFLEVTIRQSSRWLADSRLHVGFTKELLAQSPVGRKPWPWERSPLRRAGAAQPATAGFVGVAEGFRPSGQVAKSLIYEIFAMSFVAVLALFLAIALLGRAPLAATQLDLRHDTSARDYAARVLALAPPRALVLTSEDRDSFALGYAHTALGLRPDTIVIVEPLLGFAWYRANLRARYPELGLPDAPSGDWRATLLQANPARGAVCRSGLDAAPLLAC